MIQDSKLQAQAGDQWLLITRRKRIAQPLLGITRLGGLPVPLHHRQDSLPILPEAQIFPAQHKSPRPS